MGAVAVMTLSALAIDIPNPIDVVTQVISAPAGWAWDKVAQGITSWVLGAVAFFVDGIVNFLLTSARPNVEAAWFSGADSPYATVRNIAGVLLLGFVFLGLIQGLLAGDAAAMMRRVTADLPASVLGMIGTTVVVGKLLELTDALSAAVLTHSGSQAVQFLSGFGTTATGATQGFAAVLLGLVAVVAGLFLWVELMLRSVLVYILVALSPLSFAAMVWPSARGVLRRTIELLLSVILSKLVVCIAISVGVAALAGAGGAGARDTGVGGQVAASMGTLFVGTAILVVAAFAPFLILKLIPWTEAALVAHGMSRSPVRAANTTVMSANSASSIARLAGGGGKSAPALPAGGGGNGWVVGAPLQGSAAGGSAVGAAAGPAGVAAAGGAMVASAGMKHAARSIDASSDVIATGGTASSASTRGSTSADSPRPEKKSQSKRPMDAPPSDGDSR
jgi:type IV secretion system protein TrbL